MTGSDSDTCYSSSQEQHRAGYVKKQEPAEVIQYHSRHCSHPTRITVILKVQDSRLKNIYLLKFQLSTITQ